LEGGVGRSEAYYQGIRGSAALATSRLDPAAVPAESLEPGELRRLPFGGELLGAVRVRGAFAALPLDAFDRLGELLEAEEQGAYLQLLRLAWGEGQNYCRAGKRELMGRLRLSERRLNRILDALVERRLLKPLHRDNRGTLWRVFLPGEARGETLGDDVLLGRAAPIAAALPRPPQGAPATAAPSPPARPARRGPTPKEWSLARALAGVRGGADDPAALAAAAREVRELLDEGQAPARIQAVIDALRRRSPAVATKGPPRSPPRSTSSPRLPPVATTPSRRSGDGWPGARPGSTSSSTSSPTTCARPEMPSGRSRPTSTRWRRPSPTAGRRRTGCSRSPWEEGRSTRSSTSPRSSSASGGG
jgi:hypothetical protein